MICFASYKGHSAIVCCVHGLSDKLDATLTANKRSKMNNYMALRGEESSFIQNKKYMCAYINAIPIILYLYMNQTDI